MTFSKAIVCFIFPPLAVSGLTNVSVVTVLWLMGWVPGILGALALQPRSCYETK
jgi:uncharacterized membrane protein YqaE (UPF0057 family)